MVTKLPLLICFLLAGFQAFNQIPGEKELVQKFTWATEDEGKIEALGELAELYSIYRDNKKVDSILQKQMLIAEVSQNQKLMLRTTSSKAIDNIATWSSKETFDRAMSFLQKKLDYAKKHDNSKLEAFTYLHLASLLRKRNLYDQAMDQMALAFPLLTSKNDSLKSTFYLELGDTFLGKGDAVSAYKNYNSAYDVAYSIKNIPLQSATWHRFANLYKDFGDTSLSKNALLESLRLNTKNNYAEGRLSDYIDLFRQTDEIEFLKKAMFLADSLHSVRDQLFCKRLMFSFIMVVEKNAEKSLAYLKQNPDLNLYLSNNGLPNYNIGAIYQYGGQYAEAVKYYLLDEPLIMQTFETSVQLSFFREVANCYHELKNVDKAIEYYEKAFNISKPSGNYNTNATITLKLSQLYAQKKDFENAYQYGQLHGGYNEALKTIAKQKEVALLGLEREKKKHEKDLEDAAAEELRLHNLQFTGISMATAFLFIMLLVTGMFPVSKTAIRMLNFVSFICLFEFIILLIDNWLHDITHGEPLKIWLAKIFIIGLLLPLHHYLEHVAIKFLSSQKLLQFRRKFSFKKLLHPSKKTIRNIETNMEESTLV